MHTHSNREESISPRLHFQNKMVDAKPSHCYSAGSRGMNYVASGDMDCLSSDCIPEKEAKGYVAENNELWSKKSGSQS